eukprot:12928699-Prorocentrum_lima.AAC.1
MKLQDTTKGLMQLLKSIPLHRIPAMEGVEEKMRHLLCKWSFLMDKRAARDARDYKASIDAQAYEAFMG